MAQYDVYVNPSPASREQVPYLVDLQSDLLADLKTRFVMPLTRMGVDLRQTPRRLAPMLMVAGERVMAVPQLSSGMDVRHLKKPVASLADQAGELRDALDAVISGI